MRFELVASDQFMIEPFDLFLPSATMLEKDLRDAVLLIEDGVIALTGFVVDENTRELTIEFKIKADSWTSAEELKRRVYGMVFTQAVEVDSSPVKRKNSSQELFEIASEQLVPA